jgi:hypothetical protein
MRGAGCPGLGLPRRRAADTGLGSDAEESADAPAKATTSVRIVCEATFALSWLPGGKLSVRRPDRTERGVRLTGVQNNVHASPRESWTARFWLASNSRSGRTWLRRDVAFGRNSKQGRRGAFIRRRRAEVGVGRGRRTRRRLACVCGGPVPSSSSGPTTSTRSMRNRIRLPRARLSIDAKI